MVFEMPDVTYNHSSYVTEDANGKYGWNQKTVAIIDDFQ